MIEVHFSMEGGEMMAQGKQSDQKMKPYLVYEYLMRHSDEFAETIEKAEAVTANS